MCCWLVLQSFKSAGQSPFEIDAKLLAQEQPGLVLTQVGSQTSMHIAVWQQHNCLHAGAGRGRLHFSCFIAAVLLQRRHDAAQARAAADVRLSVPTNTLESGIMAQSICRAAAAVAWQLSCLLCHTTPDPISDTACNLLHVWLQDACRTCDADCSLVCKAMQQAGLSPDKTQVLILHPKTLAEVLDSITTIGRAAGVPDRAQQLVEQLQSRLQAVAAVVQAKCPVAVAATVARASTALDGSLAGNSSKQPAGSCDEQTAKQPQRTATAAVQDAGAAALSIQQQQQQRDGQGAVAQWQQAPRVLSLEGLNPLVLGGQWLPDVKLTAGAVDASGQQPGDPPTRITWEQVCGSKYSTTGRWHGML